MKFLSKCLILILAFCLVFSFASCAKMREGRNDSTPEVPGDHSTAEVGGDSYYTDAPSRSDAISGAPDAASGYEYGKTTDSVGAVESTDPADPEIGKTDDTETPAQQVVRPYGLITAAAWNENVNYDFWKSLFAKDQSQGEDPECLKSDGKFLHYYENNRWGFDSTQRVKVTVKQGETPVAGATVLCLDEQGVARFAAKTGSDGIAYLFPEVEKGTVKIQSGDNVAELSFEEATCELEATLEGAQAKAEIIKIMLVLDATGSMGDELRYIRSEIINVIERVASANNGVRIDLAVLFYRDDGDDEKFAYYDFENVTDQQGLNNQLANLKASKNDASGGGDTPEAVDEALELAMSKNWGNDTSTKLIFHVLDAPPHSNSHNPQRNYEQRFEKAVRKAAELGIRLCPILCSGADELCEYLVRQEAIYTGGTFIFVTDDSGIGNAHYDPNIPDAVVEKLNDLMVRLIDGYYTGTFADPVKWDADQQQQKQSSLYKEVAGSYNYTYEGNGIDHFSINLKEDGTFSFYETYLASNAPMGNYTVEKDNVVILKYETYNYLMERVTLTYQFQYESGRLIFLADQSERFMYVELPDGAVFERALPEEVSE